MKNYYRVDVKLEKTRGVHIIKARSAEDALRIREKYGISYPRHAKDIVRITHHKIDMKLEHNKWCIERRKQDIGGSIWYEDENGKLQTEK